MTLSKFSNLLLRTFSETKIPSVPTMSAINSSTRFLSKSDNVLEPSRNSSVAIATPKRFWFES